MQGPELLRNRCFRPGAQTQPWLRRLHEVRPGDTARLTRSPGRHASLKGSCRLCAQPTSAPGPPLVQPRQALLRGPEHPMHPDHPQLSPGPTPGSQSLCDVLTPQTGCSRAPRLFLSSTSEGGPNNLTPKSRRRGHACSSTRQDGTALGAGGSGHCHLCARNLSWGQGSSRFSQPLLHNQENGCRTEHHSFTRVFSSQALARPLS